MMETPQRERLYNLLPAIYRQRDADEGEKLRALLAVMEQELTRLEEDIETLYENWFVETCEPWAIPYIADLLGVEGLADPSQEVLNPRAFVGNTIAYRRRKGTVGVLERLTKDLTGWDARAVEGADQVTTAQHVQHVRGGEASIVDLRQAQTMAQLDGPFDGAAHRPDLRGTQPGHGRYNVGTVGLSVWRQPIYRLEKCEAARLHDEEGGYFPYDDVCVFHLHPAGINIPLFNVPQPKSDPTETAQMDHLPARLNRAELANELDQRRQALAAGSAPDGRFTGNNPVFRLYLNGINGDPVPGDAIAVGDLSSWQVQNVFRNKPTAQAPNDGVPIQAVLDPELGRLMVAGREANEPVYASYAYAGCPSLGGGPYRQGQWSTLPESADWQAVVDSRFTSHHVAKDGTRCFTSLREALDEWQKDSPPSADLTIDDNGIHDIEFQGEEAINLSGGQRLVIRAAEGKRPCLRGSSLSVVAKGPNIHLTVSGLLIDMWRDNSIEVKFDEGICFVLSHCTVPFSSATDGAGIAVDYSGDSDGQATGASLSVSDSIVGRIKVTHRLAGLTVRDSVVGALDVRPDVETDDGAEPMGYGADVLMERTTVLGPVTVQRLSASDVVFADAVAVKPRSAENEDAGSIRYSYVPPGSQTPPRLGCQPDLALQGIGPDQAEARAQALQRIRPHFTSIRIGQPGFAQLSGSCPAEIRTGAENRSEMGAFQRLHLAKREAALRRHLADYIPVGLDLEIHYET